MAAKIVISDLNGENGTRTLLSSRSVKQNGSHYEVIQNGVDDDRTIGSLTLNQIDGFRVDVMHHLVKDMEFRDNPPNPEWRSTIIPCCCLIITSGFLS